MVESKTSTSEHDLSAKHRGRLMIDPADRGSWNMAVDQALLQLANESAQSNERGLVTLRFYRWSPATLSLGYFQKLADRETHPASQNCEVIRRASGGGAIVHDDGDLTYSLCLPSTQSWSRRSADLYRLVHTGIQEGLKEQGIEVELYEAPSGEKVRAKQDDPFLCFQRRAVGDLICNDGKIGGSAQRRLKNALLQHGSLLLSQSPRAPELKGLGELSGKTVDQNVLVDYVCQYVADAFGIKWEKSGLTELEQNQAKEFEASTWQSNKWLNRR